MSRGRYELSTRARVDLLDLWDYVARESGFPDRADSLVLRIRGVCQQIADFPGIGTRREELAPGMRSFPVPPFLILYRIPGDDSIEVLRVVHGARDLPHLMSPQDQPPETGSF